MNTIFKRLTAGGTALCLMLSLTTLPAFADDETTADAATPAATETTSGGNTDSRCRKNQNPRSLKIRTLPSRTNQAILLAA